MEGTGGEGNGKGTVWLGCEQGRVDVAAKAAPRVAARRCSASQGRVAHPKVADKVLDGVITSTSTSKLRMQ